LKILNKFIIICSSLPDRTTLESETKALDDSKPTEVDSATKVIASDEGDHAEDKNEEKSDDQEKEE